MQGLEYILVAAAVFFVVSFLFLLNTLGVFDCCKSNNIKSSLHCLNLIITHSDQVLKEMQSATKTRHSRADIKTQTQEKSKKLQPHSLQYCIEVGL